MTTILATHEAMWADNRVCDGEMIHPNPHPKVVYENGWLIGIAGHLHAITLYRRWAARNFAIGMGPRELEDDGSAVLALSATGLLTFERGIPIWGRPPEAIGSGSYFAVAALKAGADPRRAVEIAIDLDPYSGGEACEYRL